MKFLLDANFLVYCVKQKIGLQDELSRFGKPELYVLDSVVKELEKIAGGKGKDGAAGRLALKFIQKNVNTIKSKQKPDDELVLHLKDYIICTNDKKLIQKIKKKKGKVVSVRKKKLLIML